MKNYVIIGGSSGIGEALTNQLAPGNNLYVSYKENKKENNDNVQYHYYNVTAAKELTNLPEVIDGLAYCPGTINLRPFTRIKATVCRRGKVLYR